MHTISKLLVLAILLFPSAVSAVPNENWAIIKAQAEKEGDQETLRRLNYVSKAGTIRKPDGTEMFASCCGEADAYETDDFEIDKNGNLWAILTCNNPKNCEAIPGKVIRPPGTKVFIPNDRHLANHDPVNNTGHGWVWISDSGTTNYFNDTENMQPTVICFVEGAGN